MKQVEDVVARANAAIEEAERCRLEARAATEKDPVKYGDLFGQPSGWCVVTQGGFWSRKYHDQFEEPRLRDCIGRGHRVVLTVGIVAKPESPLNTKNHVYSVIVREPCKLAEDKLALITTHAKIHASAALSK